MDGVGTCYYDAQENLEDSSWACKMAEGVWYKTDMAYKTVTFHQENPYEIKDAHDGAIYWGTVYGSSEESDCGNCGSISTSLGTVEKSDDVAIYIGTVEESDSYIENVTFYRNVFCDSHEHYVKNDDTITFTLPDNIPEGSTIYVKGENYTVENPSAKKGGELYLKGCEVVEMKGLDFQNTKVKIEDSKNVKVTESHFGSNFPIEGSMVEVGGDSHDVTLSHSIFDYTQPEEIHAYVGMIGVNESYTEVPDKTIKNIKEEVPMVATSLSVGVWVFIVLVAVIAAKFASRLNWRSLLWPVKKLFLKGKSEAKKVEEAWESIEGDTEEA